MPRQSLARVRSRRQQLGAFVVYLAVVLCLVGLFVGVRADDNDNDDTCDNAASSEDASCLASAATSSLSSNHVVPAACTLVMAASTLPGGGWGVFSARELKRGAALHSAGGDVVLHVHDLAPIEARLRDSMSHDSQRALASLRRLVDDYGVEASLTGGFYEGNTRVVALAPGIAQLANNMPGAYSNVLPFVPTVDEGGLTRQESPGAGAITSYHNWTWVVHRDLLAGQEVFTPQQQQPQRHEPVAIASDEGQPLPPDNKVSHYAVPPVSTVRREEDLQQTGYCLDHLRPLARSKIPHAGRGVAAVRYLAVGTVVVPVPVLPLWQGWALLQLWRKPGPDNDSNNGRAPIVPHSQLLLNYCWGHAQSSLLLVPYGPWISLVNHAPLPGLANVRLQWATTTPTSSPPPSWKDLQTNLTDWTGLLELVAIRDIAPGDEIWIDYGAAWATAWEQHVAAWRPPPRADAYAPAYVHDDAIQSLRTVQELQTHPYPDNIFTSCFYDYNRSRTTTTNSANQQAAADSLVTVPWQVTRGVFELRNLRPCVILKRENSQITRQRKKQGTLFAVQIKNRPGLDPQQEIPAGEVHVVSKVPRHAVRFSDKPYTTDPHLEGAFRHELHLPDDVFPEEWKDLREEPAKDEAVEV